MIPHQDQLIQQIPKRMYQFTMEINTRYYDTSLQCFCKFIFVSTLQLILSIAWRAGKLGAAYYDRVSHEVGFSLLILLLT